jgi:hypothetical protein
MTGIGVDSGFHVFPHRKMLLSCSDFAVPTAATQPADPHPAGIDWSPTKEIQQAHRALEAGREWGKIVVKVNDRCQFQCPGGVK